jgi:hypothetical protein
MKMSSPRSTASAFALLGTFVAVGCQSSPAIELVKNGILRIENDDGTVKTFGSTTVGKAFEGAFQHPRWASFEVDVDRWKKVADSLNLPIEKPSLDAATEKTGTRLPNDCSGIQRNDKTEVF